MARESAAELKKQAKAAEKEAEKKAKAEAKAAAKAPTKAPAAAVKVKVVTKPVAAKLAPPKPAVKKPTAAVWSCPADGAVHPWNYKGAKYLRNSDHQVWKEDAEGGCGDWCGVFLIDEDRIDDSVEEPDFE
jgi:hypothetical protein